MMLSPHSLTKGLCVIKKIFSKYSLTLLKNTLTCSKFSLLTLPKTSSNTVMFGLGKQDTFVSTVLIANADRVFSNPLPAETNFST